MKYIKYYENLLSDFYKKKGEIEEDKEKIISYLEIFLNSNKDKWKKWKMFSTENITVTNFDTVKISGVDKILVTYECRLKGSHTSITDNITIPNDEFLKFMENPDLYIDIKKYNL